MFLRTCLLINNIKDNYPILLGRGRRKLTGGVWEINKGVINCSKVEHAFQIVGCTGIEPVTSCLSSMRSEPTELTPLPVGKVIKKV